MSHLYKPNQHQFHTSYEKDGYIYEALHPKEGLIFALAANDVDRRSEGGPDTLMHYSEVEPSWNSPVLKDFRALVEAGEMPAQFGQIYYWLVRTGDQKNPHYRPLPLMMYNIRMGRAQRWERRRWREIVKAFSLVDNISPKA